MKVTVNKVDEANVIVSGTIENSVVEAHISTMAIQAGKEMKVDGFRKGKSQASLYLRGIPGYRKDAGAPLGTC